jgi:hypothetical protein
MLRCHGKPAAVRGQPLDSKSPPPNHGNCNGQEYIKENLQPFLVKALAALAREKPEEPLRFLADWLIENNPNNPKPPASKAGSAPGGGQLSANGSATGGGGKDKGVALEERAEFAGRR